MRPLGRSRRPRKLRGRRASWYFLSPIRRSCSRPLEASGDSGLLHQARRENLPSVGSSQPYVAEGLITHHHSKNSSASQANLRANIRPVRTSRAVRCLICNPPGEFWEKRCAGSTKISLDAQRSTVMYAFHYILLHD